MEKKTANLPELLSPCGSPEALRAAVYAGADAVYLGGTAFNARINAANFDRDQLRKALDFCHGRGVRLYVTLNTILTDRKLGEALEFVNFLYENGVDALITADWGLSALIRSYFPDLELHASTQFSGHNASAARWLKEHGFSRMVCARELSREDLSLLCRRAPLEIELFVHGALCASHSGQCLMSSFIGGRSGNRGECAQPCRMSYNGGFPLSLKDLCLAHHMEEILDLGVASLKIEGRMKSPQYVYQVTSVYRRLLDERRNATDAELRDLAEVFSRSGFTDGYFTRRHRGMTGIRREADKRNTREGKVAIRDGAFQRPPIAHARTRKELPTALKMSKALPAREIRTARFHSPEQIPKGDFFEVCYLPLERFDPAKANGVVLPAVITDSELPRCQEKLKQAVKMGAKHALVGNVGHLAMVRELGVTVHGDFRLNLANSFSDPAGEGLEDVIVSCELNLAQIRDLRLPKAVIVYGRIPVMLLERNPGAEVLKDRKGARFAVLPEGSRSVLIHNVPVYMADKASALKSAGVERQHFIFTDESPAQVREVIRRYQTGAPAPDGIRRIK